MKLIQCTPDSVSVDSEALRDLDLYRLGSFFLQTTDQREIEGWFGRYLTRDIRELSRRSELILALLRAGSEASAALQRLLNARDKLRRDISRMNGLEKNLTGCTLALHALRRFTEAARELNALLQGLSGDSALLFLQQEYAAYIESPAFREQSAVLTALEAVFVPPRTVALAVNVDSGMEGTQFGVIGASGQDDTLQGLFDARGEASGDGQALIGLTKVVRTQQLQTLERLLVSEVEKQWRGNLTAAWHEIKRIRLDMISEWLEDTEGLVYCQTALRWAGAIARRNYPLCTAEVGDCFAGEELYYPHMAATNPKAVIPSGISYPEGSAVFITGGNHSGKSSYLKSVSQGVFLALLGFPIPAKRFTFVPVSKICTLFAAGEETGMTTSRSGVEQERFASLRAGRGTLVLLNEPYSGLEPEEGARQCAEAVEQIAGTGATVLTVTHLYEAYFQIQNAGRVSPVSLVTRSRIEDGHIRYSYTLEKREPECNSFAERIAAEMGVSASLLLPKEQAELVERYLKEVE